MATLAYQLATMDPSASATTHYLATTPPGNITDSGPSYSTPVMGLLGFLASICSFVTVVGNLLVITAFFVERQLRSATNYFIASLAITDLLIGMFSMNLYTLYLLLGKWPLGRVVCDLWLSLDYTACLTSQYTVLFITVDRFCSVKIPAKYRKWRSERKVQVMVAATWLLPAMLFVPSIFAWPYVSAKKRPLDYCYAEFSEDLVYNTVLTICYFWVTLIVMIGLYIGIYRVALNLARKSEAKRQKVSNLMTMANQTAKVGIGITNAQRTPSHEEGGDAGKSPQRPLMKTVAPAAGPAGGGAGGPGKSAKAAHDGRKASKKDKKKGGGGVSSKKIPHSQSTSYRSGLSSDYCSSRAEDDRSSSPALPSDSDNGQHTPEPASVATATASTAATTSTPASAATGAANNSKQSGGQTKPPNLATIHSTVQVATAPAVTSAPAVGLASNQKLTASNDSDYHTASGISYENTAMDINGVGVHFAVPLHQIQQTQQHTKAQQFSLCAPSDEFEGLRYIDEESIRSNPSIDSMRLLIELLPRHAFANDCAGRAGSPVWKRRPSFSEEAEAAAAGAGGRGSTAVQTRVDLDTAERDRIVTSVVELPQTAHQMSGTDDVIEVIHCSMEEPRKTIDLPAIAQSFRDATRRLRRRMRTKRRDGEKKKQSRTENRARKALKTITLILGAFVICWTPYHIFILIQSICKARTNELCMNTHLFNLGYWLCYINSPINPFCYALANAQFKKTFLRIMRLDLRRR